MYVYLINSLIKIIPNQSNSTDSLKFNNESQVNLPQIVLHGCFLYESMNYQNCPKGFELEAKTDINNDLHNVMLNIPYPMIGKWYLALWKECFDRET
jgi:hypothetical protein